MQTLTVARMASGMPMGSETYQEQVCTRAQQSLESYGNWQTKQLVCRSLRSRLDGNCRLPMGALVRAGARQRRAIGRLIYRQSTVVHRMNFELPPGPLANVMTLHDVVPWEYPDEAPPASATATELRQADAVICVSSYSAQRAVELLGIHDPVVVPNGVDARFYDAAPIPAAELASLGIHTPFVLTVGGASLRKNLVALAGAWPRIRQTYPDLRLVLAGPEHDRRTELFAPLEGTVLIGRLPDAAVPGLISAAAVLVIPSITEGFGLPALEAMACRTPVVAANSSALPEVVGDCGVLVPPNADGIVDGVLDVLAGSSELAGMLERGRARAGEFTWDRCAAGHAEVWARVAGSTTRAAT